MNKKHNQIRQWNSDLVFILLDNQLLIFVSLKIVSVCRGASKQEPYRRRSSLGWLRFSRFFSMRSARSCLSTTVAYSILPCKAAIRRDATLPRSRMEKDLCASSVWMNINRNILLWSSWLKRRKAFSTLAGDCRGRQGEKRTVGLNNGEKQRRKNNRFCRMKERVENNGTN